MPRLFGKAGDRPLTWTGQVRNTGQDPPAFVLEPRFHVVTVLLVVSLEERRALGYPAQRVPGLARAAESVVRGAAFGRAVAPDRDDPLRPGMDPRGVVLHVSASPIRLNIWSGVQ